VSFEFFSLSFELGRIELRPKGAETASSPSPAREAAVAPGQFEGRMAAIGQQQSLEVFLLATASGYRSGLSLYGRLHGAVRQTEGTH